ncbi:MAG: iron ABC transporter permease [Candidatus Methanomethylophilaceae archaeon]|nr:iron ABC transporter permease [Candidatus Methanomethylophilaceae archaeon]
MTSNEAMRKEYKSKNWRINVIIIGITVFAIIAMLFTLGITQYDYLNYWDTFDVIWKHITGNPWTYKQVDYVVCELLTPRSIGTMMVGGALAIGGATMQAVMKNPLADPYTTGISSGAGLGATLAIVFGISIIPGITGNMMTVTNAFLLSLIPMAAILLVAKYRKLSPSEMILVGIGIMYFFSAATTVMMLMANPLNLKGAYTWGLGNLGILAWNQLMIVVPVVAAGSIALVAMNRKLKIISISDRMSRSLGENPERVRFIGLLIVSLMTAAVVSFTGTIGFVGIVAPHMVRLCIGSDLKYLLPASFVAGGAMLILADAVSKVLLLPVGVITSIAGGPIFLYILVKQRKKEYF